MPKKSKRGGPRKAGPGKRMGRPRKTSKRTVRSVSMTLDAWAVVDQVRAEAEPPLSTGAAIERLILPPI